MIPNICLWIKKKKSFSAPSDFEKNKTALGKKKGNNSENPTEQS